MIKKTTKEWEKATIMFLSKQLPGVSEMADDARQFILHPFNHTVAYQRNGIRAKQAGLYWCCDCGQSFTLAELKDYRRNPDWKKDSWSNRKTIATCPHCGMTMQIVDHPAKSEKFTDIVAVRAKMGEWTITRYFNEIATCKAGDRASLHIEDIGADWEKDGKTYRYIARIGGMYYSKYFKTEQRHFTDSRVVDDAEVWDGTDRYDMPDFSLERELERRGIDDLHGLKLTQILEYMENDPHFETLWKQGDWEIAKHFKKNLSRYWPQIRICRKHRYNIENFTEWKDMYWMLQYLGKDLNNPKYICPANLHEAHNAVLAEYNRKEQREAERRRRQADEQARQDAERRMKEAKQEEEAFIERRQKYFGLCIAGEGFSIVPLKSIDEFKQEGDTLNHCVFRCGYYSRAYSLILSARDKDNNPIETIEINLNGFSIVQCYGYHDSLTPLHNAIMDTMKENMWRVKEIAQGKVAQAS